MTRPQPQGGAEMGLVMALPAGQPSGWLRHEDRTTRWSAGCRTAVRRPGPPAAGGSAVGGKGMRTLCILWQRLVDEGGRTCDRCGATETAVWEAARELGRSLKGRGVEVVVETRVLSVSTFLRDPLESNRIWIAGEPIEKWLEAGTGQSRCCSACGTSDCRTMAVDGRVYEAIPAELIIKAGLVAGGQLHPTDPPGPCCAHVEPMPGCGCSQSPAVPRAGGGASGGSGGVG